jgi:hypothetical protein
VQLPAHQLDDRRANSQCTSVVRVAGTEPAADLPKKTAAKLFRRQLRGAASQLKLARVRIHKLWD